MRQVSLARRITATVVGFQLLLAAGLTVATVMYGRAQLLAAFDEGLSGRAMSTLALVRYTETKPLDLAFDPELLPPSKDPVHKDVFEIRKANGQAVVRSDQRLPPAVEESNASFVDFVLSGVPYRAAVLRNTEILDEEEDNPEPTARVTVIYGVAQTTMRRHLAELGASVAGTSLLLLLLASAAAAWAVQRRLEPLRELAAQAGRVSVHNWNFHSPEAAKSTRELAPVAEAMETVLGRLKESFRQQRDFTNDVAHELKTSVAIVKSTLQSLLHRPRPEEEYRTGLEALLGDCARLEDLLDRMLRLARIEQWAESGAPRKRAVTELTSTCEAAVSRIQALARARDIHIEMAGSESLYVSADPQDLELIWVNLLENAVQYGPAGSKVLLSVKNSEPGLADVFVDDSGPGIAAEELSSVFERFRRGDPSRARSTGGFGLGLAICKTLVEAYGGTIEASNRAEGGTRIHVQLPRES